MQQLFHVSACAGSAATGVVDCFAAHQDLDVYHDT
jgi:hypothetical protein